MKRGELLEECQVIFTEVAQNPEIRAVHLGDVHESQVLSASLFNFTRAEHTMAIGVDQDGNDQLGRIGMLAEMMVLALNFRGIYVLKNSFIDIAVMLLGK